MKWEDTTAATCRYGEIAGKVWGDWDVLWEDSEADYQGHASFLAKKGRKYVFYEWWYGSCSGCDGWEADGSNDEDIAAEMHRTAMYLSSKKELKRWLEMLDSPDPRSNTSMERGGAVAYGIDFLSGGLRGRIDAIRAHLGMPPLPDKEGAR